jgi:hypothetical protein
VKDEPIITVAEDEPDDLERRFGQPVVGTAVSIDGVVRMYFLENGTIFVEGIEVRPDSPDVDYGRCDW